MKPMTILFPYFPSPTSQPWLRGILAGCSDATTSYAVIAASWHLMLTRGPQSHQSHQCALTLGPCARRPWSAAMQGLRTRRMPPAAPCTHAYRHAGIHACAHVPMHAQTRRRVHACCGTEGAAGRSSQPEPHSLHTTTHTTTAATTQTARCLHLCLVHAIMA